MTMPESNSQECTNGRSSNDEQQFGQKTVSSIDSSDISSSSAKCSTGSTNSSNNGQLGEHYWKVQYDSLLEDYNRLQRLNDKLEDKLLNIVEECEKNKQECVANVEYEKSTLMADVNKLSTKLVDARIRLHDYEEKELLHAAECDSPCHKGFSSGNGNKQAKVDLAYDPNLV